MHVGGEDALVREASLRESRIGVPAPQERRGRRTRVGGIAHGERKARDAHWPVVKAAAPSSARVRLSEGMRRRHELEVQGGARRVE